MEKTYLDKIRIGWVWVSTKNWVGSFDVNQDGIIIETPPIAQWARGLHWRSLLSQLNDKGKLLDWKLFHNEDKTEGEKSEDS